MSRKTISLDGQWQFWLDTTGKTTLKSLNPSIARKIRVPAPWQANDGLRDAVGIGWYQRSFKLAAADLKGRAIVLRFGAVDYNADVWVNGKKAGKHEGGYLPFELDVTRLVPPGNQVIPVPVDRLPGSFPEIPAAHASCDGPRARVS